MSPTNAYLETGACYIEYGYYHFNTAFSVIGLKSEVRKFKILMWYILILFMLAMSGLGSLVPRPPPQLLSLAG